jgi:5-methyltetrahydrofolate--homocysteine methyltransferase
MLTWNAKDLADAHDRTELYKGYWRGDRAADEAYVHAVKTEFDPAYADLTGEIISEDLVDARGYYGFFPVIADNETVMVLDPDDFRTERAVFKFGRVADKKNRSIADYLRPEGDFIAVQIVTLGGKIGDRRRDYFKEPDKQSRGFYLSGMANFLTEELSDKVTAEIRRALFISGNQGRRYGFGYPGLPPLDDQVKLFDLMSIEDRLGIELTAGFELSPVHSSLAIYIRHPQAE